MKTGIATCCIVIAIIGLLIAYDIAQERYLAKHNCVLVERIPASNGFGYGANGTSVVIIPEKRKYACDNNKIVWY